ncbi:Bug family tripartite tricarboxylate transporter substrate binding protein [Pseudorhodoferax sp.]|uniref:Bug family tripartite tricarboxylate transporter substrate binding protein n=1 Tax=Pseudorhodoferax sp. TaxID=1993553 RepID=UPI0039E4D864
MPHAFPRLLATFALAAGALAPLAGAAQSSFKSPIRVIVPYAPGGGADAGARLLAPGLSKELGQNIFIENKPGANGQIGTQLVQHAAPDGTTLLFTVDHSLIVVPLTTPGVTYDANRDFVALGQAFRSRWTLTIPANAPYKDFAQFAEAARKDPLIRSYGVSYIGGAPGAVGDAIGKYLGVEMVAVPFPGSAPAMQSVMGNQVPSVSTGMPEAVKAHHAGRVRVVALTGPTRSELLPEVPTFKELGVQDLETVRTLIGFFAPKGLPPAMAREFNAALRKVLATPQVHEALLQMSLEPANTTLEEAASEIEEAGRFWKQKVGGPR